MALQKVQLGVAERRVISGILSRVTRKGVDKMDARVMREIRKVFRLRETDKMVDRLTDEAREAQVSIPDWDNLFDLPAWMEEVNEELTGRNKKAEKDEEERPKFSPLEFRKHEKALLGTVGFIIDEAFIAWLADNEDVEWNKVYFQDAMGKVEAITVSVPLGQVDAIASTDEALKAAEDVKNE